MADRRQSTARGRGVKDLSGCKAGVDNGVKIGFADLASKGAWGQTSTSLFTGKTTITFDFNAFNHSYVAGAETAAHEGAHGVDKITSLGMMFWGKVLGTETHAYEAETAVDRGLSATPVAHGYQHVWNWSLGSDSVSQWATHNAHVDCQGGCFGEPPTN